VGAGLGVALHNIPLGVGVGIAVGIIFGFAKRNPNSK